jgi:hypothetical protein
MILNDRPGRPVTVPNLSDFSVRNSDETIIDDLTGKNDPAPHDAIDRVHSLHSRMVSSGREDGRGTT